MPAPHPGAAHGAVATVLGHKSWSSHRGRFYTIGTPKKDRTVKNATKIVINRNYLILFRIFFFGTTRWHIMVVYPINIGIHGLKIHVMQWEQWGLLWTMDPSVEFYCLWMLWIAGIHQPETFGASGMKEVWTSKEVVFTNKVVLSKLTGGNYWELPSCLWHTNAIRVAGTYPEEFTANLRWSPIH